MPTERILRFIADPAEGEFEALAGAAETARRGEPSTALYRAAVAAALPIAALAGPGRQPVLALAPAHEDGGSRLVDEILARHGNEAGSRPIKPRGIDPGAGRSWLAARQRDRSPALLAGSGEGFSQLLAPLERRGLRFRLPPASSVVALRTAGEIMDPDLPRRLAEILGLAAERLWLAWEAPGVATPFFAAWREPALFQPPPWTRVRVGSGGRMTIFDLANLGGELEVETAAEGRVEGGGFLLR